MGTQSTWVVRGNMGQSETATRAEKRYSEPVTVLTSDATFLRGVHLERGPHRLGHVRRLCHVLQHGADRGGEQHAHGALLRRGPLLDHGQARHQGARGAQAQVPLAEVTRVLRDGQEPEPDWAAGVSYPSTGGAPFPHSLN